MLKLAELEPQFLVSVDPAAPYRAEKEALAARVARDPESEYGECHDCAGTPAAA